MKKYEFTLKKEEEEKRPKKQIYGTLMRTAENKHQNIQSHSQGITQLTSTSVTNRS